MCYFFQTKTVSNKAASFSTFSATGNVDLNVKQTKGQAKRLEKKIHTNISFSQYL